jgi:hypothetical protein
MLATIAQESGEDEREVASVAASMEADKVGPPAQRTP